MKYVDTPFGNLISSYLYHCDGLGEEDIIKALHCHAQNWGGCISCQYSLCPAETKENENIWHIRLCQVGLKQDNCPMHTKFPE